MSLLVSRCFGLHRPLLVSLPPLLSLPPVRFSRKDKLYGFEEGHSHKNEVRNDRWIRKRRIRSTGEAWRASVGLTPDPFKRHSLVTRPDWSFKDGSPGYLTPGQADAVDIMSQMCDEVRRAFRLVKTKV